MENKPLLHKPKKSSYFARSFQLKNLLRWTMFFVMLYGESVYSQNETMFSQTFVNPAFINPGYAGSDTGSYYNVAALNRMQTTGFDKAPNTMTFNVNGPLNIGGVSGGLNATFINDRAGFLTTPSFNFGYAYRTVFNEGSLGIGLSAGLFFSTVESGAWKLPDGNVDPALPTGQNSKQSFDLGLGFYYAKNKWYAGASVTHLIRPVLLAGDIAVKVPQNYYLMAGYKFLLNNPDFEIRPAALILTDLKSSVYSVNALMYYRNKYWIGLDYRHNSSLGFIAGLNLLPELRLGYSFGYNTSMLSKFSGGNHEVLITYRFSVFINKEKMKYKSIRYL